MDKCETSDVPSFHPIKVRDTIGMFSNNKNLKKIILIILIRVLPS